MQEAELPQHIPEVVSSKPNRLNQMFQRVRGAATAGVVAFEVVPVTNEGSRYGALAASELLTHNPAVGAAVLGGSTLLVEGAGALATAELLTKSTSNKIFNWLNEKIGKVVPADAKMSKPLEAGTAMTAGTSILMAVKQREKPEWKREEARRYGLLTAAWMAGVFAVEGAMISEGVDNYTDPKMVGAALLTTGAVLSIPNWIRRSMRKGPAELKQDYYEGSVEVTKGGMLTDDEVRESARIYEAYRDEEDGPIKIGLYGEDLDAALQNPDCQLIKYEGREGSLYAPLLVPAEDLHWYNLDVLKKEYGQETKFYYYSHPPLPQEGADLDLIKKTISEEIDKGSVIFTDVFDDAPGVEALIDVSPESPYQLENLGGGNRQRTAEVFAGPVTYIGVSEIKKAPSMTEVYRRLVDEGEVQEDLHNGVSVIKTIDGEDAERIWEIYKAPFDKLSAGHPMYAGFQKSELLDILSDPAVDKVVNRVDGKISTLCFFVQNFDHCPWFNKQYYQEHYPEYYHTGNIAMFPGIVTDEAMQGNNYAMNVIDMATKLLAERGSNMLITFECTETSAAYIPGLVKFAVGHSGAGEIFDIDEPVSHMEYKAILKA